VVLMLENRSFDNLLGYLYSQKYPAPREQQFEGVDGKNISNPIPPDWQFTDENGKLVTEVPVAPISDVDLTCISPPYPDPGEDYPHVNIQLFNPAYPLPFNQPPYNLPSPVYAPAMNGFVSDYIQNYIHTEFPDKRPPAPAEFYEKYKYIMECYDPAELSVLSGLAREFAVFDHWFCSVPSETICNRNFWHAGTSWGHVINPGPRDDACDQDNWPNTDAWVENSAGCTLFSQLAKSTPNISWKIYSDNKVPLCDTQRIPCRIFRFFSCLVPGWIRESFSKAFRDSRIAQIGFVKAIFDRLAVTGNLPLPVTPLLHLFDFFPQFDVGHPDLFNTLEGFKSDCANGQLPAYSFIEPNFFNPHNDMHPSTPGELVDGGPQKLSAVLLGEKLVWEIYNAIFTSPQLCETPCLSLPLTSMAAAMTMCVRRANTETIRSSLPRSPRRRTSTVTQNGTISISTVLARAFRWSWCPPTSRRTPSSTRRCPTPRFSGPCVKNGNSNRFPPAKMHLPVFMIPDCCVLRCSVRACRTCRYSTSHVFHPITPTMRKQ
jgi:hypothetical protein